MKLSKEDLEYKIFNLKHEHEDIFISIINGQPFIYRPLTQYEFKEFLDGRDDIDNNPELEEALCNLCILYPKDYNYEDTKPAGLPNALMNNIIEVSSFHDSVRIKEMTEMLRDEIEVDFKKQMENVVLACFDWARIEDMRDWNLYKLLDYYTRAEYIIQRMRLDMKMPWTDLEKETDPLEEQGFDPAIFDQMTFGN